MEVERLILLRGKTENEVEKSEMEDIIQNLQEVLIKEIWFDLQTSNDETKSMHELNSKLQNEIELFKIELAKEKNEKEEILKEKYSLYEKLRLLEQNKTESKSSYEFIINQLRGELDILKTNFKRLCVELDAQKSKNSELQSIVNVYSLKLDEQNCKINNIVQANIILQEEIVKYRKTQTELESKNLEIISLEKTIQQEQIRGKEAIRECNHKINKLRKDLEFEYVTTLNSLKDDKKGLEQKVKSLEKTNEKTQNELNIFNQQNEEIRQKYEEISISLKSLIEIKTALDEKILILERENSQKDFFIKKHASIMDDLDKFYDQYLNFLQKLTDNQDLKLVDQKKDEDFLYENILCPMEKLENSPVKLLKRKSPEKNESSTLVNVRCIKKICINSQRSNFVEDKFQELDF
jgi:hypothetical protein